MHGRSRGALAAVLAVALLVLVPGLGGQSPASPSSGGPSVEVTTPHPLPAGRPNASAAGGAAPVPSPSRPIGTSAGVGSEREAQTLHALQQAGTPLRYAFLPDLSRVGMARGSGPVGPSYTTAPAPIGVADFGVTNRSGTLGPENVSTSRLEGTFAPTQFTGLAMDTGAPDYYGVQLNAVLQNVTLFGNSSYSFWTQNVAEYSPYSHQLTLLDNLWNFSDSSGRLSYNALLAHSPNGTQVGTTYYYALGPTIEVGYPFTLRLFLDANVEQYVDTVYFNYTVSNATVSQAGSFDELEFNSLPPGQVVTPPEPVYLANGYTTNALGLPDDFELAIGGPGGGSNFDALNVSAALNLYLWDAARGTYTVVPSAYDVGGDTGETAAGLSSTWEPHADLSLGGTAGPAAQLSQGPAFLHGEWNVSNGTQGATRLHLTLAPDNGFLFAAPGTNPAAAAFEWLPPRGPFLVPPASYSIVGLASHYDPRTTLLPVGGSSTWSNLTLTPDPATGVYTPLWALAEPDLGNLSSVCAAGVCTLWTDEAGPLGQPANGGPTYPWFGAFNDFLFPEFAGILLWDTQHVRVVSPPTLSVSAPPWLANETRRLGVPPTNSLPMLFYDDAGIAVSSAAISGWWFAGAYLGPSAAQASVVFWNTSGSSVTNSTFFTGAEALYLYGGSDNLVIGDSFVGYAPLSGNANSLAGSVFGSTGLFEADFGTGDLVYNNAFGTYYTAVEPATDPYTGKVPPVAFGARWNVTPVAGTNIAGGSELGGNYWWNYGTSRDPYWTVPYNASGNIAVLGDFHPLLAVPLWRVTFVETGLPPGTPWQVGVETTTGFAVNQSTGSRLSQEWPDGEYFIEASSVNGSFGLATTLLLSVTGFNLTENLTMYRLFSLTFRGVDLPAGGFWTVTVWSGLGSWIDLGNVPDFPPERLPTGVYNFSVSAPPGYAVSPAAGAVNLTQNLTVQLVFGALGAPGHLVGELSPSAGATFSVDGQTVPLRTDGSFDVALTPGLHSVVASAPGYLTYFNNVSIANGQNTSLVVTLTAAPPGSSLEVALYVAVGVAAVLAVTTAVLYLRGRNRPPRATTAPPVPMAARPPSP